VPYKILFAKPSFAYGFDLPVTRGHHFLEVDFRIADHSGASDKNGVYQDKSDSDECIALLPQPRITPGKGRRTLADLSLAILFSE
jgi:hypothetical protein